MKTPQAKHQPHWTYKQQTASGQMTVTGKQMFDALNFSNWNFKKRYVLHIQLLEADSQTVKTLNIHHCLLLFCLIILGKVKRKKKLNIINQTNQPTNKHLKNVSITPLLQIQSFECCQLNAFTLKLGIPTTEQHI